VRHEQKVLLLDGAEVPAFEKLLSVVCWLTPGLSILAWLIAAYVSGVPPFVKRHARAAGITTIVMILVTFGFGVAEGALAEAGALPWPSDAPLRWLATAYAVAALINIVAALSARGPWFRD
jgi:hypothetical protein